MAQLFDHDITEVSVLIIPTTGTPIDIQGGEKEKVKYKRNSPYWNKKTDTSGNMGRGKNPDNSGEFIISLLKSNPQCAALFALIQLGESPASRKLLMDTFTVTVTDRMTGVIRAFGRNCFIEEEPEGTEETEVSQLDYKICTPEIKIAQMGGLFRV